MKYASYIENVAASDYWHPCDPEDAEHQSTRILIAFISDKTLDELDPLRNYEGLIVEARKILAESPPKDEIDVRGLQ